MYVHMYIYVCAHTRACVSQKTTLVIISQDLATICFEIESFIGLELNNYASLVSQQTHLLLPPSTQIASMHHLTNFFTWTLDSKPRS